MPDLDIFLDGNLAPGEFRGFSVPLDGSKVSVLNRGFLTPEFVIITIAQKMKDAPPNRRALAQRRLRKGITLAPWSRIPYNPIALSQMTFFQTVFAMDFFETR